MRRIETQVLFHPSMMGQLTAQPAGGMFGNRVAYQKATEALEEERRKLGEIDERIIKEAKELEGMESIKDDVEPPRNKRHRTGKQKYDTQLALVNVWHEKQGKQKEKIEKLVKALGELDLVKDTPVLSATQKKACLEMAIWIRYKRRPRIQTHAMLKGTINQDLAVAMWSDKSGEKFESNKERKNSDYFTAEVDIKVDQVGGVISEVPDIKCRETIYSFFEHLEDGMKESERKQLLCYCDVWNAPKAKIINVLTSTPFVIINDKIRGAKYKVREEDLDGFDLPLEEVIRIARENIFEVSEFIEFLEGATTGVQHVSFEESQMLLDGTHPNELAQKEFNDFVEVEFDDRFIIEECDRDDEKIAWMKSVLDVLRLYIAEKFNIHHVNE